MSVADRIAQIAAEHAAVTARARAEIAANDERARAAGRRLATGQRHIDSDSHVAPGPDPSDDVEEEFYRPSSWLI